jgi:hypothetical protein
MSDTPIEVPSEEATEAQIGEPIDLTVPAGEALPTDEELAAVAAALAQADEALIIDDQFKEPGESVDPTVWGTLVVRADPGEIWLTTPTGEPERQAPQPSPVVLPDLGHSLDSQIVTFTRSDGETISFDKVTTSKSERAAAIAAFEAESA